MNYNKIIQKHYLDNWNQEGKSIVWEMGPMNDLDNHFSILEFEPRKDTNMWAYATCCLTDDFQENPIELFMFSPKKSMECIEILTALAFYHKTESELALWHTVNFGKGWFSGSKLTHGLISLPYLDGPNLENLELGEDLIKFYWLIPISESEAKFKDREGIEALEQKFDNGDFNYLNPNRKSVV